MSCEEFLNNPNPWVLVICGGIIAAIVAGLILNKIIKRKKDKGVEIKQESAGSQAQIAREDARPIQTIVGDVGPGATVNIIENLNVYLNGLPDTTGREKELFNRGREYESNFQWTEAISSYQECLTLVQEPSKKIALLSLIGKCFFIQGPLNEALVNYHEAMDLSKQSGNQEGLAGVLNNIGQIYIYKKDFKKAQKNLQKAYEIYKDIAPSSQRIASQGMAIGSAYLAQGNLIKALEYLQKSLDLNEDIEPKSIKTANRLNNIAGVYLSQGNSKKALECLQKALDIFTAEGAKKEIDMVMKNIETIKKKMSN
jgi:tetratricopeptide (TPR) repeat protein